ncbi:hypothetical protein GGF31_005537 [Allomyces arbusculus]|nr:hypothetical protein GGF31_005537 [Allomyces arbusculus]
MTSDPVDFLQTPPSLGNQYADDHDFRAILAALVPASDLAKWHADLDRLGARAGSNGDMLALAEDAELNPPRLEQYNAWGHRVDKIHTTQGWDKLHAIAAEEGLVATAYDGQVGGDPALWRVLQMAKLYLYHPSSAVYSCPLAMTDGAACLLGAQLASGEELPPVLRGKMERALRGLTTRDPKEFWTSGQWMTERPGGSDVARTETTATLVDAQERLYSLTGFKWFSSATTCNMTLALARVDQDPTLSLFLIELRPDGTDKLNGIEIVRLKNKLGTKALPTAELRLRGCLAHMVGPRGRGVPEIARMITITRIYNSVCAVGFMRRALAIAQDYATKRMAFGKLLIDQPLHRATLRAVETEIRGCTLLTMYVASLLGRSEHTPSTSTTHDAPLAALDGITTTAAAASVLRILVPIVKLYTGKRGVAVVSEALELIGGVGYIEDSGIPRLLRDAQVLPIWEGTTNVLALDVVRVLTRPRERDAWPELIATLRRVAAKDARVIKAVGIMDAAVMHTMRAADRGAIEANARDMAFHVAHVAIAALLVGTGMDVDAWIALHPLQWTVTTLDDLGAKL